MSCCLYRLIYKFIIYSWYINSFFIFRKNNQKNIKIEFIYWKNINSKRTQSILAKLIPSVLTLILTQNDFCRNFKFYANFRKDFDGKDHHVGRHSRWWHRFRQSQDLGKGRYSRWSAEVDFRGKAARWQSDACRLQRSGRVDRTPRPTPSWWTMSKFWIFGKKYWSSLDLIIQDQSIRTQYNFNMRDIFFLNLEAHQRQKKKRQFFIENQLLHSDFI